MANEGDFRVAPADNTKHNLAVRIEPASGGIVGGSSRLKQSDYDGRHRKLKENAMIRILLLSLALTMWTAPAFAAIITSSNVVTSTQLTGNTGYIPSTSTFSYNVPNGTNRCLVVFVNGYQVTDFNVPSVSSVKYGGVDLTRAVARLSTESFYDNLSEIWYLVNPVAGITQNIVMSGERFNTAMANGAVTLYNVDPFTPVGQTGAMGNNADSGTVSLTLNGLETDSWIVSNVGHGYTSGANSPGANITGSFFSIAPSWDEKAAAGYTVVDSSSETFSWNYTGGVSTRASFVAAEFFAVPEPASLPLVLSGLAGLAALRRRRPQ